LCSSDQVGLEEQPSHFGEPGAKVHFDGRIQLVGATH
jgi:hypothetical protein